jgi:hypothetical protein
MILTIDLSRMPRAMESFEIHSERFGSGTMSNPNRPRFESLPEVYDIDMLSMSMSMYLSSGSSVGRALG